MSEINNTSLKNLIPTNNFLHECIDLAIDGFLFRGITPSDHYYRFTQSFPRAFTLPSNFTITSKPCHLPLTRHSTNIPNSQIVLNDQSLSKNSAVLTDTSQSIRSELNYLEKEVRHIEERMRKHRLKNNRPENLSKMTIKQILDEKTNMQQELLRFQNKYSKPTENEQKKIMKPLYDYYRQLKRLIET